MLCLLKKWERVREPPSLASLGIRAHSLASWVPVGGWPEPAGPPRLLGRHLHPASQVEQRAPGSARPRALCLSVPDVGEPDTKATQVCAGGPAVLGVGLCLQTPEWP